MESQKQNEPSSLRLRAESIVYTTSSLALAATTWKYLEPVRESIKNSSKYMFLNVFSEFVGVGLALILGIAGISSIYSLYSRRQRRQA